MRRIEDSIQTACVTWFRYQHRDKLITSFPAGYVFSGDEKKRQRTGKRMKDMGYLPGIPDLFIPHSSGEYHGLFIELKTEKGRLNDNQKEAIGKLKGNGYKCEVCRSVDEFINVINEYLKEA